MSVSAPPPPTRVPTPPPTGVRDPEAPPVFELLLLSQPERERRTNALAIAGAILGHALLLLFLLVSGPLGGSWSPGIPTYGNPQERIITLLFPGTDVGGTGHAVAPAPEHGAEAPLVTPRHIPTTIPAVPAPGAGQPGAPGAPGAGEGGAAQGAAGEGAGGAAYGNSAARFRPKAWDRRLWEPPDRLAPTQTDADRVAARVQNRIDAVNDSAAAVADAARKATDWTVKGKDGKEWGISPGKLHLGNLTLPLPLGFQASPYNRAQNEREQANWDDIQRSANQAEIRHTFDERVKAIRERKAKEREEQKKTTTTTTTAQ